MRKRTTVAAIAVALVASAVAAGSIQAARGPSARPTAVQAPLAGGVAKASLASGDIDHLDPALWYFATTWSIAFATCTPLITYRDATGDAGKALVAGTAALPTLSHGGKSYAFTVKPGVTFSNGTPITAAVVKSTFLRLLSAKMASPAYGFFSSIKGAAAYNAGKAKNVSGIVVKGRSITFNLTAPSGSFLRRMAMPFTCPVPTGTPDNPVENGSLPSSGPYMIKSYTPSRSLVLVRNPKYDASVLGARGHLDEIDFSIGVDPAQAGLQIKAGQLDFTLSRLSPQFANQVLRDPSLKGRVFANPESEVIYLWLDTKVAPFDNVKVRQAVNDAIDRGTLVRVWGGPSQGKATDQVLPPTFPAWKDFNAYPLAPNLSAAKALMKSSGVKTPITVVLRTRNDADGYTEMAQAVQAELKPLGIDVKIGSAPDSVNFGIVSKPANHIPMGINSWSQDYPDGDDFIGTLLDGRRITPTNNNDLAVFNDPAVNARIDRITPMTGLARAAAWQALDERIVRTDAPWAPLMNTIRVDLISSSLSGYVFQPVYEVDIAAFSKK